MQVESLTDKARVFLSQSGSAKELAEQIGVTKRTIRKARQHIKSGFIERKDAFGRVVEKF